MQLLTYMHEGIYTRVRNTCLGCGGEIYTEVRDKYMHRDLQGGAWLQDILHMHIERTSSSQFKNQTSKDSLTNRKSKV